MKKTIALVATALLVAAGCSNTPEQGDRPLVAETPGGGGKQAGRGGKTGNGKANGKPGGKKNPASGGDVAAPGNAGAAGSSSAVSGDVDIPGADEEQQYPTASTELTEQGADAKSQGITPGYAELTGAKIEGLGKEFRVTLTFDGEVPQRMPNDKTIMVVGFQMIRDEEEGYAFAGQATQEGWKPYAGGKDKQSKFPGSFDVVGNQIVMVVPWSYPRGAYPFKWMATSNWFQSLASTTHYKFDLIPNKDQANFPG